MIASVRKNFYRYWSILIPISLILFGLATFLIWWNSKWERAQISLYVSSENKQALIHLMAQALNTWNTSHQTVIKWQQQSPDEPLHVNLRTAQIGQAISFLDDFATHVKQQANHLNQKFIDQKLWTFHHDLEIRKDQVFHSRLELNRFRRQLPDLHHQRSNSALHEAVSELKAESTRLQTRLQTKQDYMSPDSAEIQSLKSRIQAINKQIEFTKDSDSLSMEQQQRLEALAIRLSFAEEAYQHSLNTLYQAKLQQSAPLLIVSKIAGARHAFLIKSLGALYLIWLLSLFIFIICISSALQESRRLRSEALTSLE